MLKRYESDDMPHAIYIPKEMKPGSLPLILFLHGGYGHAAHRPTDVGLAPAIQAHPERWSAVVLMPQARLGLSWRDDDMLEHAYRLLEEVENEFQTDPHRVYITGLSSGGVGTWKLACRYPQRFAAAAPVCAGYDPFEIRDKLSEMPLWIFHGEDDDIVPVSFAQAAVDALKSSGSTSFKFTVFKDVKHESWEAAYAVPDLADWLFSKHLPR